jgi:glycosyltransferase involved in cell wall biosynthesis
MIPEISLQIPVKNGGNNFRTCLASLKEQLTDGTPWELIIIDDGSDTPIEEEFDIVFPDLVSVRIIRLDDVGNRPAARNAAWMATDSPICLLSDGDILFPEDTVMRHLEAHRSGGKDVVMGARIDAWGEDATPWQKWFDSRAMGGRPAGSFPPRYFVTGNLSIRRELLERVGGFDPAIDKYGGEDTEFGLRAASLNPELFWDPELRVYHLDKVTVREHSKKMVEYGGSGLRYTLEIHPEAAGMLGSRWIEPILGKPLGPGLLLMRILTRIALIPALYRMVLRWMECCGTPSFLFTYLSVGGCLLGLRGDDFEKT